MANDLEKVVREAAGSEPFERLLASSDPVRLASAPAVGHPFAAAVLATAIDAPVLLIGPDPRSAETLAAGASALLGPERVVRFPAWEALPYEGISPGPQVAGARARAAHRLRASPGPLVVTAPVLAALHGVVPSLGEQGPLVLAPGTELAPDALADRLVAFGYARVDVVEHRGEFAVRG